MKKSIFGKKRCILIILNSHGKKIMFISSGTLPQKLDILKMINLKCYALMITREEWLI